LVSRGEKLQMEDLKRCVFSVENEKFLMEFSSEIALVLYTSKAKAQIVKFRIYS
jgi:hypothetical protein